MSAEGSSVKTATEGTIDISTNLSNVRERVLKASEVYRDGAEIRLVAVSKTKPVSLLSAAYDCGQRHFGENYVQELATKAPIMPEDIRWHFIGALQSNKAKILVGVANLYVVESVEREKTARALNKAVESCDRKRRLKVMVQVNTSGEESKSGCQPGETSALARFVVEQCDGLELIGLMTIGAPDSSEEPEAFRVLGRERDAVAEALGWEKERLELSMGMSGDFEAAIRMGSDSVRVGSTIFGARDYGSK